MSADAGLLLFALVAVLALILLIARYKLHPLIALVSVSAAMLAVNAYGADMGRTLLYGLIVGIPTAALAGPLFGSWIARRITLPPDNPLADQLVGADDATLPGFGISLLTVLVPVLLMLLASAADAFLAPSPFRSVLDAIGNPIVALLLALLFSFWSLGRARRL